jgi:hypothetical protein
MRRAEEKPGMRNTQFYHKEKPTFYCSRWQIYLLFGRLLILNDQVKEDEMGRACSTNGEKRNAYRILVGNPEGKRPLGRPRHRWVDNIKMDLREIRWDGMDWNDLAQDRDQCRALVNVVLNLRVQ